MSGPNERTFLSREIVLDAIRQAASLGFYNVVFTGGEATMRRDDMLAGLRLARELRLVTRLVTNAHWATSVAATKRFLDLLLEAGLDEINFSTGDEHARFIPIDRVVTAAVVAAEQNLRSVIVVELRSGRKIDASTVRSHERFLALSETQRNLITIVESPWMPLDPSEIESYPDGMTTNRLKLNGHLPCDNVLTTYTVQADGRVGACCGIGMREIPELNVETVDQPDFLKRAIEDAEQDLVKLALHFKGPEQILEWAAGIDPSIEWQNLYAHHCQACARVYRDHSVRQVVRDHCTELLPEVVRAAELDIVFRELTNASQLPSINGPTVVDPAPPGTECPPTLST